VVSTLHETGRVLSVEYVEDGTRIRALASPEQAAQLAEFDAASVPA
jgi:GTP-binding protein HflX